MRSTPGQDVSAAYRSGLTITGVDAYGSALAPGLVLLLGGFMLCAVVLGRRAGRVPPA